MNKSNFLNGTLNYTVFYFSIFNYETIHFDTLNLYYFLIYNRFDNVVKFSHEKSIMPFYFISSSVSVGIVSAPSASDSGGWISEGSAC